ncbi:agmatine deiminase family protein [Candidatus Poribacteria bacterium]|nr:agmatine deiminase family protein [Candidatus Poribacteria bacterium]
MSARYRMPAEWEPHAATWLAWPHNPETWYLGVERAERAFVEMIRALVTGEIVCVLVNDEAMELRARTCLQQADVPTARVRLHRIPTNDAWIRDYGPNFVATQDGIALNDWGFNMWGGKYPPWDLDDAVPAQVAALLDMPRVEPGLILEGGSIDVNGTGTLLTTESCLLNPTRNPGMSVNEIENVLRRHLGVTNVLWLGEGIVGDDTDGHVDDITRFVGSRAVVTAVEDDPSDENHEPLADNLCRLQELRAEDGMPLEVVPLPMPEPVEVEGVRLPASYLNFYIGNECVLLPVFGGERDALARSACASLFPTRRIVPIMARDLVLGLGACHCLTQQQPAHRA